MSVFHPLVSEVHSSTLYVEEVNVLKGVLDKSGQKLQKLRLGM